MNSLFGLELPTPVNFIIAFVVVLGLIGLATWAVRRFGAGRLEAASRGRQPRLAVVDSAAVDGRRRLIIIRRDNIEHLLMVGGPSDVVVETNIVRAGAPANREAPARGATDALPRAMPLPDPTPWPLAPEPAAAPVPARAERMAEHSTQWPMQQAQPVQPATAPRAARQPDPVAALAAEIAPKPAARAAQPAPSMAAVQSDVPAPDQSLAEMAQRLEAALRRPAPAQQATVRPELRRTEPAAKPAARAAAPAAAAAAPAVAESAAAAKGAPAFESLEQEMASLLGRPASGSS